MLSYSLTVQINDLNYEDNDVVAIHADMRRSANRLVEEAMITANICAGRILNPTSMQVFSILMPVSSLRRSVTLSPCYRNTVMKQ